MKLDSIDKKHLLEAVEQIDKEGIPLDNIHNNYWVIHEGGEYPFKYLVNTAYSIATGYEYAKLGLKSTRHYRNYIEKDLGFEIKYYQENINFFNRVEIEEYKRIITNSKKYSKESKADEHKRMKMQHLVKKVEFWAKKINVEDFALVGSNIWQIGGTIRPYIWRRFYRKGDSRRVYFKIGVSVGRDYPLLFCEIDCDQVQSAKKRKLPKFLKKQFDDYLDKVGYKRELINLDNLEQYDWNRLIEKTINHIINNASYYDNLEKIINQKEIKEGEKDSIIFTDKPKQTKSYANKKRFFKGQNKNWQERRTKLDKLGKVGEELVLISEKKKLIKLGKNDLADKVRKMLDGEGYDIRSFDKDGNEIHIEVKTTARNIDEPFYMSLNEKDYLEQYPKNYFLYRLYNYSYDTNSAECYKLSSDQIKSNYIKFSPKNFEVSIQVEEPLE